MGTTAFPGSSEASKSRAEKKHKVQEETQQKPVSGAIAGDHTEQAALLDVLA